MYLIIEIDGYSHLIDEIKERDLKRENKLKDLGFQILRFSDVQVLKDIETLAELSLKYSVHSNQILKWKKEFIENSSMAFAKKNEFEDLEKEKEKLLMKVGELQMDNDFLKKSLWKLGL